MIYEIKATSADVIIDGYTFTSTPVNIVQIPILQESNFSELFDKVSDGSLSISFDGVDVTKPVQIISNLINLVEEVDLYNLSDEKALKIQYGGISSNELSNASSGIEFTGGFAGKPLSNSYVWEAGVGINITQDDVNDGIFKTFSLDSSVQAAVDTPYWTEPTPADHTDKGVFGGSYLPSGVDKVFDYTSVDSDTYEDGTNVATTGGFDFSQLSVGDKVEVRFDFNAIPQVANTTIEPAVWYKNRDADDNVTFTFPLTAQPIFYGTGTVGETYLNRVNISIYIASQEDINSLSHLAIKSDNRIIIQPLSVLFTLVR